MDSQSKDIRFSRADNWFSCRASGIIIKDGKVLMVGNNRHDYFYSLGGAVQFGETTEEACVREVFEETGLRLEIDRLLFIHENFFTGTEGDFLQSKNCHELSFYFLMKEADLRSESFGADGSQEFLKWLPISEFQNYKAFPQFFADELTKLPTEVKRIITHE